MDWYKIYVQESHNSKKLELIAKVKGEELAKHVKSYFEIQFLNVKMEKYNEDNA